MTTNNDKNGLLKISMEFPHISTNNKHPKFGASILT